MCQATTITDSDLQNLVIPISTSKNMAASRIRNIQQELQSTTDATCDSKHKTNNRQQRCNKTIKCLCFMDINVWQSEYTYTGK